MNLYKINFHPPDSNAVNYIKTETFPVFRQQNWIYKNQMKGKLTGFQECNN